MCTGAKPVNRTLLIVIRTYDMITMVQYNVKKVVVAEADKDNVADFDCPTLGQSYVDRLPR